MLMLARRRLMPALHEPGPAACRVCLKASKGWGTRQAPSRSTGAARPARIRGRLPPAVAYRLTALQAAAPVFHSRAVAFVKGDPQTDVGPWRVARHGWMAWAGAQEAHWVAISYRGSRSGAWPSQAASRLKDRWTARSATTSLHTSGLPQPTGSPIPHASAPHTRPTWPAPPTSRLPAWRSACCSPAVSGASGRSAPACKRPGRGAAYGPGGPAQRPCAAAPAADVARLI